MSDILISGIIIICCLFVFVVMSYLVVDSYKKNMADKKITVTFTEIEQEQIIAGAKHLRQWSELLKAQETQRDPTIEDIKTQFDELLSKQQAAIEKEDYMQAAECRDELESLKLQLKKFEDEDQT